ncbi:hypothetical protein OX284_004975 [Flavobacterium sp. SUN046]|uniref:hypothetical protein n=1 Tax=Flavobacterium sp. SUN046 TaxID=3002440 RepID=UPI002DBD760C|nr:hypothetical protein [Flavobacterium sp. SUN046]MEC4048774.1 hypothetical protein [Flavobacterium sp. SUN046]
MIDERLYINGEQVDLMPSTSISRTLQVNDISSLENRQSSFTRNIDLPKSPINTKVFNYLGVIGNQSNAAYQRNTADYYIGNECMIYQGWVTVSETSTHYKINIYDGVIDLYKAIENDTFSVINLSGITHQKDLPAVLNSWTSTTTPYKYVLADFNGKTLYSDGTNSNIINIDYLSPSVNVKWLWDKIFTNYGFTYSGTTFQTNDFENLWMTYPKGVLSTIPDELELESTDFNFIANVVGTPVAPNTKKSGFFKFNSYSTDLMESIQDNTHYTVTGTSMYRVQMTGKIKSFRVKYYPAVFSWQTSYYSSAPQQIDIWICKNANGLNPETVIPIKKIASNIGDRNAYMEVDININEVINITHGESISLMARTANQSGVIEVDNLYLVEMVEPLDLKISKVTVNNVSFQDALQDFKIKDFLNEIVWRFGLTIFKDKYTKNYTFLTLDERINSAKVVNWSSKFDSVVSEKYIYGTYSQNNWLKYSYNDDNSTYKDGLIQINNINLEDASEVIKSKIYSPEKDAVFTIPFASNQYKLWEKDISDNNGVQEITYKALDKRFCFLRSVDRALPSVKIGSEALVQLATITTAPIENFNGLSFQDIVQNYYSEMTNLLNKAKVIVAKFHFKPIDISGFDFKAIYFIEQLGGYYLINKINNYNGVNLTEVELIKIEYKASYIQPSTNGNNIIITSHSLVDYDAFNYQLTINYTTQGITDSYLKVVTNGNAGEIVGNTSPITYLIGKSFGFTSATIKLTTLDGSIQSNDFTIIY